MQPCFEKYSDHELFVGCIGFGCPIGWMPQMDKIVTLIETHNNSHPKSGQASFAQVKTKFGQLVVYLDPRYPELEDYYFPDDLYTKVNQLADSCFTICKICGVEKIKTVVDSHIRFMCWDHWNERIWHVQKL